MQKYNSQEKELEREGACSEDAEILQQKLSEYKEILLNDASGAARDKIQDLFEIQKEFHGFQRKETELDDQLRIFKELPTVKLN